MVPLGLMLGLIFLGLTVFLAIKDRQWWLAGFALVAGMLLASNKLGVTVTTTLNEFATWFVHLFQ
jgi:hypothetical protein